ncbi:hypothetical protein [Microbacterium sp. G2-8]|uniref:hypothetical protein n=1 Tax=Microbacterium sp. G2-8 TaxID=2842454 RepID=UPI001C8A21B4|nr:hypothetical protein [Microbacterium sp. G2-8]
MPLSALRDDALTTTADTFALRLSLPWIRSLPLSSFSALVVEVDGTARATQIRLGDRTISDTTDESGWWHLQDRLVVVADVPLGEGPHEVAVAFRLAIPYLPMGGSPLEIPHREIATLDARRELAFAGEDVR